MPSKAAVSLTNLDFDEIRASIKTYFEADATFKDYNFEGSGLAILLDILAYNTHYSAFTANMMANEMFLESAQVRKNLVALAKQLGYRPSSRIAPSATVTVAFTPTDTTATSVTISKGTNFTSDVDGTTYNFINRDDVTVTGTAAQEFTSENITLKEGTLFTFTHTVNTADANQRFIIPNPNVDTSTLTVKVQTSATDTTQPTYTLAEDYTDPGASDTNYFLQEVEDNQYEVYFGDGVIGKKPVDGNLIVLEYMATNATAANLATTFTLSGSIAGATSATVTTVTNAAGGTERETADRIKLLAPRDYATQGRVVTVEDYKTRVLKEYADAQSVKAYGGEDASEPYYGRVYVAIKPKTGVTLSDTNKTYIKETILKKRNVVSITPEIVDPQYIYVIPTVTVKFNSNNTTDSAETIKGTVTDTIKSFSNDKIEAFDSVFRHSVLTGLIDDSHEAIESTILTLQMKSSITPTLNTSASYTLEFDNALYNPHSEHNKSGGGILSSTSFSINDSTAVSRTAFFDDDGAGNLRIYYLSGGARTYINSTAGTVAYATGKVTVTNFNPTAVANTDNTITITVKPDSVNLVPVRNQIIEILDADISVTVSEDTAASSGSTTDYGTSASGY